jgi:hypothetical protein
MNDMSTHLWTMYILVLPLIVDILSPPKLVITRGKGSPGQHLQVVKLRVLRHGWFLPRCQRTATTPDLAK